MSLSMIQRLERRFVSSKTNELANPQQIGQLTELPSYNEKTEAERNEETRPVLHCQEKAEPEGE